MKQVTFWILLLMVVTACSQEDEKGTTPSVTAVATTAAVTLTSTPQTQPTAPPLPTATVTPILPTPSVTDQTVNEDGELIIDGVAVDNATTFAVDVETSVPAITIDDQDLTLTNTLRIASAELPTAGWLLLQTAQEGTPSNVLGLSYLEAGRNEDVTLSINPIEATPRLSATLYRDNGRLRQFDLTEDTPFLTNEQPVTISFTVTLPQDIYVLDQPVVNDQVEIERIIINTDGWVAVYNDNEGELGFIIGSKQLEAGLNQEIVVDVTSSQITPQLYLRLHTDNEPMGEFNPGADLLLTTADGRVPGPLPLNAAPGPYLTVANQPISTTLIIPLAVVSTDSWLAIYTNEADALGTRIGQTWLPAGINRQVLVELDEVPSPGTYYAALHQDTGTLQQFEESEDTLIQYNGRPIQLLFQTIMDS